MQPIARNVSQILYNILVFQLEIDYSKSEYYFKVFLLYRSMKNGIMKNLPVMNCSQKWFIH
jgi:hypothetical protein